MQVSLDQKWIDRLVDDELTTERRRELLSLVEANPEAWRRVALAFLEAQAWRGSLADFPQASIESRPVEAAPVVAAAPRFRLVRPLLAACLLAAAFGLGFAARGGGGASPDLAAAPSSAAPPSLDPEPVIEPHQIGRLELTTAQSGEFAAFDVPLYTGGLPPDWDAVKPSAVPEYVRAKWEREGYEVEERRELYSVGLGDGREAVVPVEDVRLRYVGRDVD